MNREEWLEVVQVMQASWPHSEIPDVSIAKWYDDLRDCAATDVRAALESFNREGREFPPNGGMLFARIRDLTTGELDHGAAWGLVQQANRRFGLHAEHRQAEAMAWIDGQSPETAEAVRRFGADALATYNLAEEGMVRAQFRDFYRAVCDGERRADLHPVLPRRSEPRPLRTALAGLLEKPEEAA